jgi:hypothetical protein
VDVPSKVLVCGHSISGIAGSNSSEGMDLLLLCLFCVVQVAADRSLREVLPGVSAFNCEWSINLNSQAASDLSWSVSSQESIDWTVRVSNPLEKREFSRLQNVHNGSRPTHPPTEWIPWIFPEVKRQGSEVNQSSPASVEVKNKWSYNFTTPVSL